MSAAREIISALVAGGMDAVDAAALVAQAAIEMGAVTPRKSTGAIRQQRYRDRNKASQSVTRYGEKDVVTDQDEASQSVTKRNDVTERYDASLSIEKKDSNYLLEREGSSKPKASRVKPRSRLPEDWSLGEADYEYAAKHGFDRQKASPMGETFKNHHHGKGTLMADWHAAWRTWVGNEIKYSRGRNGAGSNQNRTDTAAGRAAAREADILAAVGRGALRVLENGHAARSEGAIPANARSSESHDSERDSAWSDYQARVGAR